MDLKRLEKRSPLRDSGPNSSSPALKRRRLSINGTRDAPIIESSDSEEIEIVRRAPTHPGTSRASSSFLEEVAKGELFFPSPSPEEQAKARPRRLELKHRALPAVLALPSIPKEPEPFVRPHEGPWTESDEEEEGPEPSAGYEQTVKERIWHATPSWYGTMEIFRAPRKHRAPSPPSSPAPMDMAFRHDQSLSGRWAALGPQLDTSSYNPPRPPNGMTFTPKQAQRWLIKQERCVDIGEDAWNPKLSVWKAEELFERRRLQKSWHDSGGQTKRLEETLPRPGLPMTD